MFLRVCMSGVFAVCHGQLSSATHKPFEIAILFGNNMASTIGSFSWVPGPGFHGGILFVSSMVAWFPRSVPFLGLHGSGSHYSILSMGSGAWLPRFGSFFMSFRAWLPRCDPFTWLRSLFPRMDPFTGLRFLGLVLCWMIETAYLVSFGWTSWNLSLRVCMCTV
jgi:hypothetical protein